MQATNSIRAEFCFDVYGKCVGIMIINNYSPYRAVLEPRGMVNYHSVVFWGLGAVKEVNGS